MIVYSVENNCKSLLEYAKWLGSYRGQLQRLVKVYEVVGKSDLYYMKLSKRSLTATQTIVTLIITLKPRLRDVEIVMK